MISSIIIFVLFYIILITEKIEKSILAVAGAVAVIFLRLLTFEEAVEAIDLNVIFLLIGMMTTVNILAETGFFEWIAIFVAKKMKGNAFGILGMLLLITTVFSAFLDNVTTVILISPLTILITQLLELPTIPFLILEALASNIGGTSTLIGDPPNIIIGSKAALSFNEFLIHLGPNIIVISVTFIALSLFINRKSMHVPENIRSRVLESYPELAIRDPKKLKRSLMVFGLIFVGFFLHNTLHIEPGFIALGGMAIMLFLCKSESDMMLKAVEWDSILFFIGLFIIIGALEHNGVIHLLATYMIKISGGNIFLATMIILWGSAFFSSILDNIPFVITMIPLVQQMVVSFGGTSTGAHPLFWALALGACLGGNGTLIGASANVVIAKLAKKNGYDINFRNFFKFGAPMTLVTLLISTLYIWIRYFVLKI